MSKADTRNREHIAGSRHWLLFLFVLTLSVGILKNVGLRAAFGVDLTVVTTVALWMTVAWTVAFRDIDGFLSRLSSATGPILVFIVGLTPSLFLAGESDYASKKIQVFFALTLPSAIALALLVDSRERLHLLFRGFLLSGVLACVLALAQGPSTAVYGRYAVGDDVLSLGYSAGAAALVLIGQIRYKSSWRVVQIVLLAFICSTLLATGSRGPLLGVFLAASAGVLYSQGGSHFRRGMLSLVLLILLGIWSFFEAPDVARERLLDSNLDATSVVARVSLLRLVITSFANFPFFGVGFANFREATGALYDYPHNMLAEVAVESGLVGLVGLLVLLGIALRRLVSLGRGVSGSSFMMLLVLFFTKAMVSSDLRAREIWFLLVMTAVAGSPRVSRTKSASLGAHGG